jgi:spermidine synthase
MEASRPPFYFLLVLFGSAAIATYEIAFRQPAVYLVGGFGPSRQLTLGAALAGAALGAGLSRVRRGATERRAPLLLGLASLAVSCSALAWFAALSRAWLLPLVAVGVPFVCLSCLAWALCDTARVFADTARRLRVLERALNPFRLLGMLLVAGVLSAIATRVGLLRAAVAIGLLLALACAWWTPLATYLHGAPLRPHARWFGFAIFGVELAAVVACERLVPMSEIGRHTNAVAWVLPLAEERYTMTSGQDAYELFIDGRLRVSTVDQHRYFEALVHPALTRAPRRSRVLVLGGGHGCIERELLRYPDVREIVVVTEHGESARVAAQSHWLTQLTEGAMTSNRVRVIVAEPLVWLAASHAPFDVAIVDLPDPGTYADGKYYTRYFYTRLRDHLVRDGVIAAQTTSGVSSPGAFASIHATLRAAGLHVRPYHAAVPMIGDWYFVLASPLSLSPPVSPAALPTGLRFLTPALLASLFALPRDAPPSSGAAPSYLFDQHVVEAFTRDRETRGL